MNFNDGEIRNLHYGIIHANSNNIIESNTLPYINFDSIPKKYTLVVNGDLILADTSEDRIDSAKGIEISNDSSEKVISGLHTIHLREKKNHTIIGYKTYFVASKGFRHFARKYCEGIKVFSIKPSLLKYATFSYPNSIDEQQKIVDLFAKINIKINLIESKISTLKKYKKGLAKEAIKETINYWKFGIGKALDLSNYLVEINEYSEKDGTFPHITLSTEGISDKSDRYDRDFLVKDDNKKYKITRLNQLCYNPANLKFGVICINRYGDGIFSPIYVTFRIKNIELDYLELIITSNDFNNYSMKYQQGTVYERMAVSPEDLCKIKLVVNDDHKQKNIAYAASILNEKISKLECELNNLKIIKTNLLNNMFI